jgi:hypothetical protein
VLRDRHPGNEDQLALDEGVLPEEVERAAADAIRDAGPISPDADGLRRLRNEFDILFRRLTDPAIVARGEAPRQMSVPA